MKNLLIIINAIFGLATMLWLGGLLMIAFLFDAPGSQESPLTVSLAVSIASYPLFYILGLLWSIKIFKSGRKARAILVSLLPLISITWMIITVILIKLLCDGKLSCQL